MRKRPGREARLDPVRWRRPGRGALARWAAVTLLLATAAIVLWSRPSPAPSGQRSLTEPVGAAVSAAAPDPFLSPAAAGPAAVSPAAGPAGAAAPGPAGAGAPGPPDSGASGPRDSGADGPRDSGGHTDVPAGTVGVPVRLAEPTALRLVRPGDRVDLFRVGDEGAPGEPVATAALVLEIAGVDDPASGGLLLALTPAEAERTVTTAGHGYAVLIRPDG